MPSCDTAQNKLCKSLGKEYRIQYIDMERCIYRDFGNNFDVEISGTHTTSKRRTADIYLWYDKRIVIKYVRNVSFSDIGKEVDKLYEYTCELYRTGPVTYARMYEIKHG